MERDKITIWKVYAKGVVAQALLALIAW